uniref:Uncharacterized protein n=1 Tax=Glossina austeni TaxID=7395 RepID=A0A1A9UHQ0_GLOAU
MSCQHIRTSLIIHTDDDGDDDDDDDNDHGDNDDAFTDSGSALLLIINALKPTLESSFHYWLVVKNVRNLELSQFRIRLTSIDKFGCLSLSSLPQYNRQCKLRRSRSSFSIQPPPPLFNVVVVYSFLPPFTLLSAALEIFVIVLIGGHLRTQFRLSTFFLVRF